MNLEILKEKFEEAKKKRIGIELSLTVPTQIGLEEIYNPFVNLDYKLNYYLTNYIEIENKLVLKHCHDIEIVECRVR